MMDIGDKERFAFSVWAIAYGRDWVTANELMDNEPIYGGFIWRSAEQAGYLEYREVNEFRLTAKAIALVRESKDGNYESVC